MKKKSTVYKDSIRKNIYEDSEWNAQTDYIFGKLGCMT